MIDDKAATEERNATLIEEHGERAIYLFEK